MTFQIHTSNGLIDDVTLHDVNKTSYDEIQDFPRMREEIAFVPTFKQVFGDLTQSLNSYSFLPVNNLP